MKNIKKTMFGIIFLCLCVTLYGFLNTDSDQNAQKTSLFRNSSPLTIQGIEFRIITQINDSQIRESLTRRGNVAMEGTTHVDPNLNLAPGKEIDLGLIELKHSPSTECAINAELKIITDESVIQIHKTFKDICESESVTIIYHGDDFNITTSNQQ